MRCAANSSSYVEKNKYVLGVAGGSFCQHDFRSGIRAGGGKKNRLFEIRTYYANEGKLDALKARFRDHTVALFKKHGMTNVGYWVPVDNKDNKLVYILAFPNKEARKKAFQGFVNDPDWKAAYKASTKDGKLVKKIDSEFLTGTDFSAIK